jgi:hypothetical protein
MPRVPRIANFTLVEMWRELQLAASASADVRHDEKAVQTPAEADAAD